MIQAQAMWSIMLRNFKNLITSKHMSKEPYESDTTKFLKDLFQQRPELRERQLESRKIWWDRAQNTDERAEIEASNVNKKPYEYY